MTTFNEDLFGNVGPATPSVPLATPNRRPKKKNPNQLYLFATGKEIMEQVGESVDRGGRTMEKLWRDKTRESEEMGYPEKFQSEGIQHPVTIVTPDVPIEEIPKYNTLRDEVSKLRKKGKDVPFIMGQGHHRVATSNLLGHEGHDVYIPVMYDNHWNFSESSAGVSQFPYGPGGLYHEFAKNNPVGKWAGVDPMESIRMGDLNKPRDDDE